jgi:hypothetical protein
MQPSLKEIAEVSPETIHRWEVQVVSGPYADDNRNALSPSACRSREDGMDAAQLA